MSLTGLDPFSPVPGDYRELLFAQGVSSGGGLSRDVLLIGNRTTAGTETVDAISSTPIADDADCIARCGRRSELLAMYRKAVAVDPGATYYIGPVAESGGTAASVQFTFATTATDATNVEISFMGSKTYASVSSGDTAINIASAVVSAINAADEGTWMCTAANGGTAVVTVTMSIKGPRHGLLLGSSTNVGMRMRFLKDVTTTVSKGALTAGTTEDDGTAIIAAAANLDSLYYLVSPWHTTSALIATDNQTGELVTMVTTQALPVNGKEMQVIAGLVATQANATTIATSTAGGNSVRAKFIWQKNSDWSPAMLAAHWAATLRAKQIAHPGENLTGHGNSDQLPFLVPAYYVVTDRPSASDVLSCINNGVTVVGVNKKGSPIVVRDITSRSLNAQGNNDYRAREGHITSAIDFVWNVIKERWVTLKQPFVDNDPAEGQKPTARTSTPSQLKNIISGVIDDMCSSRPLGVYDGPILAPSKADAMKKSIVASKIGGGLSAGVEMYAVEHLYKTETKIAETSSRQ